jgi:hypothetical protein
LGLAIAVIGSTLFWAQNCGRRIDNEADLRTLDNFAAGKRVKTNKCSGDPSLARHDGLNVVLSALLGRIDWETTADKAVLTEAVNAAFSAVPADVQNIFLTLNGRILVTNKSNAVCTDMDRQMVDATSKQYKESELKALKEDLSSVSACYLFGVPSLVKRATGKSAQLMTIVLPDDPNEIRHSLVRTMGYLVSNVFSRLIYSSQDKVITWISEENPVFTQLKDKLAKSFLKDVNGTEFQNRFSKYLAGGKASRNEKQSFASFVYAEAFDSFYCNSHANDGDNTRKVMSDSFTNTFSEFAGVSNTNEVPKRRVSDSELNSAVPSIDLGMLQTRPNMQFQERLFVVDWLKEADKLKGKVKKPNRQKESLGLDESEEGFGLSGGFLSSAAAAWNSATTAVSESVQGAGILYSDYSKSVEKSVQKSFDQNYGNNSGLKSPSVGRAAIAVVSGVSGGTGYSDYYNNTQRSVEDRYNRGQGLGGAISGGVSDSTGYSDKYNQIYAKTSNISRQVMSDPGYNTFSPGYRTLLSTSTVLNSVIDDVGKLPKIGDYASTAQNFVKAGAGAGFDDKGNYVEFTRKDRLGALISGVGQIGSLSGASEAATGALTERGLSVLADAGVSNNRAIRSIANKVGDGVVFAQALGGAYEKAAKSSEMLSTLNTVKETVELGNTIKEGVTGSN